MWLMPLLIGISMFIVMAPEQVSADEQSWITWDTPTAAYNGDDVSGASLYTANQLVPLTDGNAVITYKTNGGKSQPAPELLDAAGNIVESAVDEVGAVDYVRTVTISGLAPETTYKLHWEGGHINNLPNDVYLIFTTKNIQNWITWGTPTATWTGTGENGEDMYTADSVLSFNENGDIVISYSVDGGRTYGPAHLQDANGDIVPGASISEPQERVRNAAISGLALGTTYRLFWAAAESHGKLSNDVYLTFTTESEEPAITEPVQTWITFNTQDVQWKEFSSDADWYQTKNKVALDSNGNIVIAYSVNGGKDYCAAQLQDTNGGAVAGAVCSDPLGTTNRTVTVSGLSQNTTYRLFWAAAESNGKLSNDVYLTFTTAGPSQTWITWGNPTATWIGNDDTGAELYTADDAVEFNDDDSIEITYSVDGGQRYGHVQLLNEAGGTVEDASVDEPDGRSRTVTITGLVPETTYRLYWDKDKANEGERPHLSCDVYLVFTTGTIDSDALRVIGVKEKYEYTGSEIKPEFTVKVGDNTLSEGVDYEVSYTGDRVSAGSTVTMTVTGKDGTPYAGKSKSKTFQITKAPITSDCIALPKGAGVTTDGIVQYSYSGLEIKPAPVVTVNGRQLIRGTDYVLTYAEDADLINVKPGKVLTVNVAPASGSNYNGGANTTYTIIPKSIIPAVKLAKTSYTYNGKAISPKETVKAGTIVLTSGTDYSVSYTTTHKTVGSHGVKVTLKGNYTGTKTVNFKILPKKAVVAMASPGKKKVTVKLKTRVNATGGKIYQIAYRVNGTSKWKYTTTTKQSKVIKKLKKGKKYQIKARAYKTVSKVKYYGAWSKIRTTKKVK